MFYQMDVQPLRIWQHNIHQETAVTHFSFEHYCYGRRLKNAILCRYLQVKVKMYLCLHAERIFHQIFHFCIYTFVFVGLLMLM